MKKKLSKEEFMEMVRKDLARKEKRKKEGEKQADYMLKDHMYIDKKVNGRYRFSNMD